MSGTSGLEGGPNHSSNSPRKHAAIVRGLRKKVLHGQTEITELLEGIAPSTLFKYSPPTEPSHLPPIDQRINSVREALALFT
ncbi:hypothetical protein FRC11_010069, partial [Ceratobasidium sp. 423]